MRNYFFFSSTLGVPGLYSVRFFVFDKYYISISQMRELRLRAGSLTRSFDSMSFLPTPRCSQVAVTRIKKGTLGEDVGQFRQREDLPRVKKGKRMGHLENHA